VVIHYEEALYQVYAPLPLPLTPITRRLSHITSEAWFEASVTLHWWRM